MLVYVCLHESSLCVENEVGGVNILLCVRVLCAVVSFKEGAW
jgi:hypothetical protein